MYNLFKKAAGMALTACLLLSANYGTTFAAKKAKAPNQEFSKTDILQKYYISKVWAPDNGDGTYTNPIICADYSDPDLCRVGNDYYMTASSFNCVPALPILHSNDLVSWTLVNHAIPRLIPDEVFSTMQHGNGVWAPCIRYHNQFFYIYYGDPDYGIYMVKTDDPLGKWDAPVLVKPGTGLIDPTVLWDDDGKVYLIHAYAGSRAGVKSILTISELSADGSHSISDETIIFDGHVSNPTIEGPKAYKDNGYYYIFTPAGGVANGWQLVLRSKNIYGPYEEKIVLAQGNTKINGPHQGGWVTTVTGESWFIHFQDAGAYGRILHLEPMVWKDGWPVMGNDSDGDGTGEPVITHKKPNVGKEYPIETPVESDEFTQPKLGLQWQWHANPALTWGYPIPSTGVYRLFSAVIPIDLTNYWNVPNLLLQKFPAYQFNATAKISFNPYHVGEKAGLIVMGDSYAYISLTKTATGLDISQTICNNAIKGQKEVVSEKQSLTGKDFYLRVTVKEGAQCTFSYSTDGQTFLPVGSEFTATEGRWIGAKMGMFCTRTNTTNNAGFVDIDWFRVTP